MCKFLNFLAVLLYYTGIKTERILKILVKPFVFIAHKINKRVINYIDNKLRPAYDKEVHTWKIRRLRFKINVATEFKYFLWKFDTRALRMTNFMRMFAVHRFKKGLMFVPLGTTLKNLLLYGDRYLTPSEQ